MKPVVAFIITFVVGTAASTGAKVMTTKPAPAAHDSTAVDSTANHDSTSTPTDTAAVASGQPTPPPAEAGHTPAVANTPADPKHALVPADPKHAGAPVTDSSKRAAAAAPAGATRTVSDSALEASERRVAKVFTSMDAKQAAKVLEHMADSDVHIILGYVGPRQAASIMAELPPARVAKLSKMAMNGTVK